MTPTSVPHRIDHCMTLLAAAALATACHHAPPPEWESAPLLPAIHFSEPVRTHSVQLLVLDAHSGAPVVAAGARIDQNVFAPQTDSAGRTSFVDVPSGRHQLLLMAYKYKPWHDSIDVPDSAGLAIVVQLRRSMVVLGHVCTTDLRYGIAVTVMDSSTGEPPSTASLVARTAAGTDHVGPQSPVRAARNAAPTLVLNAAPERAGTYDLTVRAPGYQTWHRTGVEVTKDECHVHTVLITARLQRLTESHGRSR